MVSATNFRQLNMQSPNVVGLESDSSPYFWDSDLDSDFAHETKVKVIHELLVNDWSQEKFVFPSRA